MLLYCICNIWNKYHNKAKYTIGKLRKWAYVLSLLSSTASSEASYYHRVAAKATYSLASSWSPHNFLIWQQHCKLTSHVHYNHWDKLKTLLDCTSKVVTSLLWDALIIERHFSILLTVNSFLLLVNTLSVNPNINHN